MRIIIIGAGPAGLNAAIHAAANGNNEVLILEKNEKAGKKLFITGKGRCNVTNACLEKDFIANVMRNPHFLHNAYRAQTSQDTIDFLNAQGVETVIERGNRVFPASYHAYDVTDALVHAAKKAGVRFSFGTTVKSITRKEDSTFLVSTDAGSKIVDAVVIATGGLSYPSTGSTGDGYAFASSLGHSLVTCHPSLTGIKIKEEIFEELRNFTLKNVQLTAKKEKKTYKEFGELTFRDTYLDGPIALSISSRIAPSENEDFSLSLDVKPALSEEQLLARLNRDIENKPKEQIGEELLSLMPSEFLDFFLEVCPTDADDVACTFSMAKRRKLAHDLKNIPLTYLGLNSYERAIVTCGGVAVSEISSATMESKITPNLFFAGEVMDVDALTGGFNIQIALSTGALAGEELARRG